MAGKVVVSTLNNDTGSLATQNGMTGILKAWGSYAQVGSGSTPTLRSAFNISSITRNSTGNYTFAFTTNLPDANYGVIVGSGIYTPSNDGFSSNIKSKSTSSFNMVVGFVQTGGSLQLADYGVDFVVSGN